MYVKSVHTADQMFRYDALNRLTQAIGQNYATRNYVYDTIGNIIQKDGLTYTYGAGTAGPHAVTGLSDGTTMTYDANGNMVTMTKGSVAWEYIYDVENRLIETKRAGTTVGTYTYDGDGGRTSKTVYTTMSATGGTCFLAGTHVLMADGTTKPIEKIVIGDEVWSFDEKTLKKTKSKVTQTFHKDTADSYYLVNGELKVTANHPSYSNGEWKPISELEVGDMLLGTDLTERKLEKLEKITLKRKVPVYNIEVDRTHNYFVVPQFSANDGLLVHNKMALSSLFDNGTPVTLLTTPVRTDYVGSLTEKTGSSTVNFVYLGSTRLASLVGNQLRFYLADHLGGTNVLVDEDGTKKEVVEYDPFGVIYKTFFGGEAQTAWAYYTGKHLDDESGLYYYGARYYNPMLGRFITADTIVQRPDDPQTLNRYSYCGNNPIINIDPDGHSFWKKIKKIFREFGDFFNPLGRAIVTGDWKNFGMQMINVVTMMVGIVTAQPALVVSAALSYTSRATSHIEGKPAAKISEVLGYAALAVAAADTLYKFSGAVKDWSKMLKADRQLSQEIRHLKTLEATPQNVQLLKAKEVYKKVSENLVKALSVKPFATIGSAAVGGIIANSMSDGNWRQTLSGILSGAQVGMHTSYTRAGLVGPERVAWDEAWLGVAVETRIYGIKVVSEQFVTSFRNGPLEVFKEDLDYGSVLHWGKEF